MLWQCKEAARALFMDRNNRPPGRQLQPPPFPLTASDKPGSWLVKNPSIDKAPARWYPKRPSAHLARDSAPLSHTNGGPRSSPPSIPSFPHPPPISSGNLGCISTLPRVSQMAPRAPPGQISHPCTGCDRGTVCGHPPVTSGTVPEDSHRPFPSSLEGSLFPFPISMPHPGCPICNLPMCGQRCNPWMVPRVGADFVRSSCMCSGLCIELCCNCTIH